ncbi:MAG: type II toxin-antitoxin system HicA family toxin [Acidimicrobiales bacterium]
MPDAVPAVPGTEVVRALQRVGFKVARVSGNHHVTRHPEGRSVSVPVHQGRDMPKGTLRNILAIIGVSTKELRDLL